MALGCVGSCLVIISLACFAVQVASISKPSELHGNCPLTNPLSCGTTTLANGDTIALVPKSVTNEDIWLPELDHIITQRLICKFPDCLSAPCENGKTCTETLDGFQCSCSKGYGPVCAWTCPESWLYFQGSCYGYFSDWVTFNQALENCRGMTTEAGQADLVSIHSLKELEFIMGFPGVPYCMWSGLYQPNPGLTEPFVWTDCTPVNYTSWAGSEPVNSEQNCVCIHNHVGSWHAVNCEGTRPYACKIIFS